MDIPDNSPRSGDTLPATSPDEWDPADPEAPRPPARAGFAAHLGLNVQDLTLTEEEMRDTFEGYL